MLIGLSIILVMVASQSRPLRSKKMPLRPTMRLSESPPVKAATICIFSPVPLRKQSQ